MKNLLLILCTATLSLAPNQSTEASYALDLSFYTDSGYGIAAGQFSLSPQFFAMENGGFSDAEFYLDSPSGSFSHFEDSFGGGSGSHLLTNTVDVVNEVNGTWTLSVLDDGSTYNYEIDLSLSLPFAELTSITSDTIVEGLQLGEFSWQLNGGDTNHPGPTSGIKVVLRDADNISHILDSDILPEGTTSWEYNEAALDGITQAHIYIGVTNPAADQTGLSVTDIRSLTSGAPSLSIGNAQISYGGSYSTVVVIGGEVDGDLDGDGFVGINDLNIVLSNWNQNVPPADPLADPSGDAFVGIDDLNAVLSNWNTGTPPAINTNIPEPGTLAVLGLTGSVLIQRRRHKQPLSITRSDISQHNHFLFRLTHDEQ